MSEKALPLMSIIIPALEVDRELRRCVDSIRVVCEDSSVIEVVLVVPVQSVDDARSVFQDEIVVQERGASIYGAMNDGVLASSGRYLYFLGKDDIVLPSLFAAVDTLRSRAPDALFCDVYWGARGVYSGKPSKLKIIGKNFCHQGIIYSRRTFSRYGPYVRRMKVQADQFLNTKMLWDRKANNNIMYIRKPVAWYSGAGFSSNVRDAFFERLHPLIIERYVGGWAALLLRVYRVLFRR